MKMGQSMQIKTNSCIYVTKILHKLKFAEVGPRRILELLAGGAEMCGTLADFLTRDFISASRTWLSGSPVNLPYVSVFSPLPRYVPIIRNA